MEKVVLYRIQEDEKQTLGVLVHERKGDVFICKTLELPWRKNKPYISCIPEESYTVKWTHSPRFNRMMYLVTDVKGRSGIRIHPGNFYYEIQGCILLGSAFKDLNIDTRLDIVHSGQTVKHFEDRMAGNDFRLNIIPPFSDSPSLPSIITNYRGGMV